MFRKFGLLLLVLLGVLPIATDNRAAAAKLKDVTFSLDFIVLGRHAPWYVALAKGYYEAEGLDVKIIPGKGSAQVMQAVESGIADLGFVDVPSLVLGRAAGSTIKVVAVNYQKAPYAIFSLDPGANVVKPADLEGLTLGSSGASFIPRIHKAFMKMHGLDPSKLTVVNVAPPARIGMLVRNKVPSIDFFIMTWPGIKRAAGKRKVRALLLGDFGLTLYSNGIGAKQEYIKKNPGVVKGFVRASLRGWKDAMDNPTEAATLQKKYVKALNKQITIEELAILKNLAVTPDTRKNGYGWFSPAKMKASRDFMVKNTKIRGTPPSAEDLYLTGFLPTPPILP
jgi:NitT/TauT family transport system substrate-binding protein